MRCAWSMYLDQGCKVNMSFKDTMNDGTNYLHEMITRSNTSLEDIRRTNISCDYTRISSLVYKFRENIGSHHTALASASVLYHEACQKVEKQIAQLLSVAMVLRPLCSTNSQHSTQI
jgi:hypothetical protein